MSPSDKKRTIEEIVTALKKFVPAENFHKEPEHATGIILQLEEKYHLNTVDFLTALYNDSIEDDDLESWLSEYENFLLFDGKEEAINQQPKKVGGAVGKTVETVEEGRFVLRYRDEETLERLKAMDIISYLPGLHEQLKFLFVNSTLTQEELEAIDGVTDVRKPRMGTLCDET